MESTGLLLRGVSGCACPCGHSTTIFAASSELGRLPLQRVNSHELARSRQDFGGLPLDLRLPSKQDLKRRRPQLTRCLYSPLVESFEASRIKSLVPDSEGQPGSVLRTLSSPASVSLVDFTTEKANQEVAIQRSGSNVYEYLKQTRDVDNDTSYCGPHDPVAAAHGDHPSVSKNIEAIHDVEARRSARLRPATMSLTQGFAAAGSRTVSCAVGVAGRPLASASKFRGPVGLVMALSVALLGLATAVQKKGLFAATPKKLCSRCEGYGIECCDVCEGRGKILWEGKMSHMGSCPRCFGSCTKKCPRCGGSRMKKGDPPIVQRSKLLPPKSI